MIDLLDRLFIWLFLLFVSIFLVLISILLPVTIHEREELRVAMFDYPIPFAQQDLMRNYGDYAVDYPHRFTISFGMLENVSSIYFYKIPFFFSVLIVYIGLLIIRYLHNRLLV
ncbi:hypothetical protein [Priestia megaterium]|uniref:hypothetical protein n=1 Tax=Priestia megaterium TaxID=1404 RepID=UPI0023DA0329|nr:hypothetical protein [Priestia megaterium]MDF2053557.1 hypothetical protein [Priestia megaterium]MDF2062959.1 hypothetical protein [Priestia megaterium]